MVRRWAYRRDTHKLTHTDTHVRKRSKAVAACTKSMQVCNCFQAHDTHCLELQIQKSFYHQTLVNVHRRCIPLRRGALFIHVFFAIIGFKWLLSFFFFVHVCSPSDGKFYILALNGLGHRCHSLFYCMRNTKFAWTESVLNE